MKLDKSINILIEIPTWLGDAIMTTPAIQNIIKSYPDSKITLFGSKVSIEALKNYPNIINMVVDESKKESKRFFYLIKKAKALGKFDLVFTFRKSFSSRFFIFFIDSDKKFYYKRYTKKQRHQVLRYNDFINKSLKVTLKAGSLKLYVDSEKFNKPTLGINPGATYGSAKRWYPERFANVAKELSSKFDIIIFGGPSEIDIANDIEKVLIENKVNNYINLAGKTSIKELIENISKLSLFITGDSGPMHIAAAFNIPTIALFGPTRYKETSPWCDNCAKIVRYDLDCSPCMKRECPIKTHECMDKISSDEVVALAKEFMQEKI